MVKAQNAVLIAASDAGLIQVLTRALEALECPIRVAAAADIAHRCLGDRAWCLVVCDLDTGWGAEIARAVSRHEGQMPLLVVLEPDSWESAKEWMTTGTAEFCWKPLTPAEVAASVRRALTEEMVPAPSVPPLENPFLVGGSRSLQCLRRQIATLARVRADVCIYGETGVGKELVVRAIHGASPRSEHPYVILDCTAIPDGLMESELFGHVKGAFTSAMSERDGLLQIADGGTLFLDEIGELSLPLQAKLLRVLQCQEFRKVGGQHPVVVDVRFIAATHRDLPAMVCAGRFREDLLYRLDVMPLTVPPLREHKEDIPALADFFLRRFNSHNATPVKGISPQAIAKLLGHSWPGNVRELEHCIERGAILTPDGVVRPAQICFRMPGRPLDPSRPASLDLRPARQAAEGDLIRQALASANGNRRRAARLLGISLRNLHYKLKRLREERVLPAGMWDEDDGRPSANGEPGILQNPPAAA